MQTLTIVKIWPRSFFDQLIAHGTTTAAAFCSVHKTSVDAFFKEAYTRGMRMLGGKVLMDRNAPEGLRGHTAIRIR